MGISIEEVVSTTMGLASHRNAVPLLWQPSIANDGTEGLGGLVPELESGPPRETGRERCRPRVPAPNLAHALAMVAGGGRG